MALSPQLLQFKSSGVYRLEFDKSQTTNFATETIRLVVGHSKKGPYNTPVFVETVEDFNAVFGGIDRNLEKKGMFFHRSALAALSRGPILALNLSTFTNSDNIEYVNIVTNGSTDYLNAGSDTDDYTKFFNTDKFWFPSDEATLSTIGPDDDRIINLINIKQEPITVFIRKAQNVTPFETTAREWYGEGNVPEFLNERDYLSDFMVDVFVFKGKFNPSDLTNDPIYATYFNSTGLLKDKLDAFSNLRQVSLIAQYTGSLIPNFKDLEGRNLYIETMINSEARRTGLFCAINEDAVTDSNGTKVDLVGHMFDSGSQYELLSYTIDNDTNVNNRSFAWNLDEGSESGIYQNNGGGVFVLVYNANVATSTLKKGYYVEAADGRMAKIKSVTRSYDSLNNLTTFTVTTDSEVSNGWSGYYHTTFEAATLEYKPFILDKATIGEKSILDALDAIDGTNLFNALADKDLILYRYIVDTFGSYDTTDGILNKRQLSYLAHERQNVSAILNAPTVADFKKSTNPSFTDENGAFSVEYLKDGANLDKNPTAFYTLPSIADGANYGFYYGPGLTIRENGKDIIVPPAAYVSNNYIDKYSTALPWSIIAGPRRGVVSGTGVVGVEYAFDKNDRDVLEPFGINPIVFQRGVGLTILGNKTGQQSVKSALSSAHVREVLIYIQEGLANILKGYVFEFNTAQTRLEIKTLADAFMESVKADQGVYDFKNVIDQTNNTNEVIDNNIGILDTFVEPVKGLEIVVHRTTVLNTGEIQTGNFS